jgi:glucosylceramidase
VSPVHGNPDPNIQHPVVIINKTTHEVTYTGTYWYLAHFSKFVRPGAVRVETSGGFRGVRAISFAHPEGGYVVELLNSLREAVTVKVELGGRGVRLDLPARSISTALW